MHLLGPRRPPWFRPPKETKTRPAVARDAPPAHGEERDHASALAGVETSHHEDGEEDEEDEDEKALEASGMASPHEVDCR